MKVLNKKCFLLIKIEDSNIQISFTNRKIYKANNEVVLDSADFLSQKNEFYVYIEKFYHKYKNSYDADKSVDSYSRKELIYSFILQNISIK